MTPEHELLEEIRPERERAELTVEPSSMPYFELLEKRFPVHGSKIDWDKVPGAVVQAMQLSDSELYFKEAGSFLEEILVKEQLDGEVQVVVVGDGAMECALRMPLKILASCMRRILRMPQHTYVLVPDGSWCMVFTMEGDACFGRARPTS